MADIMQHADLTLRPDPARTVIRPFSPEYPAPFANGRSRKDEIVDRVLSLDDDALSRAYRQMSESLNERHRDVNALLERRFDEIADGMTIPDDIGVERRRVIGAYFSEEYSFEAAALFNPSMVLDPDQSTAPADGVRVILSLRGIGEGHVSSVTFRSGSWSPSAGFDLDPASETAMPPIIEQDDRTGPDDRAVTFRCGGSRDVTETVLFPVLPRQRQGIEDMRLVRFTEDDGSVRYYGTYTAFSGAEARCEIAEIQDDFRTFRMNVLKGAVGATKGMALFPRRIDGRYAMLGRQDSESVWFLTSDDLFTWDGGVKVISPRFDWEIVQMGNCGSPIELDEGWLVLVHGVGAVRNYCVGACLLDKEDPSMLLARTAEPLLEPSGDERDGYVPNVVYSCGGIVHDRTLLLPYGVADNFASFATVEIDAMLARME